jgi:hypothetical protein
MKPDDAELRDETLARSLRAALSEERAPRAWVEAAMALPGRPGVSPRPVPRHTPRLVVVFPHLCGLALLVGLGLAMFFAPDRMRLAWETIQPVLPRGVSAGWLPGGIAPEHVTAALLTPVLFFVLYQGAQGFPVLRRRHH